MNKKLLNIIGWIIGLSALIILIFRIYRHFEDFNDKSINLLVNNKTGVWYLMLVCSLMPVNWLIEVWKWQRVAGLVEKISFTRAIMSVLAGLAFGHLLPGRSSEFLGKILFFSEKNRSNISVLHFVNAAFQMYVTLLVGLFFLFFYFDIEKVKEYKYMVYAIGLIFFIVITLILIYADKIFFLRKILPNLDYKMPSKLKLELIFLSFIRYVVFVMQFYFMFLVFNSVQELNINFLSAVAVYFLFTSVIPMVSVIEVAVRALIGIITFQSLGINDLQMAMITSFIWFINLAIPSLVGFLIWLYLKRKKWL